MCRCWCFMVLVLILGPPVTYINMLEDELRLMRRVFKERVLWVFWCAASTIVVYPFLDTLGGLSSILVTQKRGSFRSCWIDSCSIYLTLWQMKSCLKTWASKQLVKMHIWEHQKHGITLNPCWPSPAIWATWLLNKLPVKQMRRMSAVFHASRSLTRYAVE